MGGYGVVRLACALLIGLASAATATAPAAAQEKIRIVRQPGLGYLSLIVMRELRLIEKRLPGVEVEWRQLTSGPVIRDAMVAGRIDIGSGGTGPFVQAIDRGIDWKMLGALNEMPLYLNCARADIKSLKDLRPTDRIAMPALGSTQHVVLQMQAEKELGDPNKLNGQIVAMAHPAATAAILSKREITCDLSSPPFQYEQLRDPAVRKIFDSYQVAGGPHSSSLVWASARWVKANPRFARAFVDALGEATDYINYKPLQAVRLYATSEKATSTPAELLSVVKQDGIVYTMTPSGLIKFAAFMQKIGVTKRVPASWRDYAFEHLHVLPGS